MNAEIKDPSVENPENKVPPLKPGVGHNTAQDTSPGLFVVVNITFPVHSLSFFFQNLSRAFPVLAVANAGFYVGRRDETGQPAHRQRRLMQFSVFSALWI